MSEVIRDVHKNEWRDSAIVKLSEQIIRLEEMVQKTSLENEELRIAHRDVVKTCARLAAENNRLLAMIERNQENA